MRAIQFAFSLFLLSTLAGAATIGQIDNFEDGTTQGWVVAIGPLGATSPAPPENVSTGGPGGVDDNYLRLTSLGGSGAGSRLVAINLAQWAGNYTAAGITGISMDLRNLGQSDLAIRLYLENPMGGPPTAEAVTNAVLLPAGGAWTTAFFNVTAPSLTSLSGNVNTLLSNVTALRIMHNPAATFPPPAILAQLGVDNIQAVAVPEPSTWGVMLGGLALMGWRKRRNR